MKPHDFITEEEALQLLVEQRALIFSPGTRFHYSNSNYFLLAQLIKRITGESLGEFSRKHIFEPLGMRNTLFSGRSFKSDQASRDGVWRKLVAKRESS